MFKTLAAERHAQQVLSDQNQMIREAAEDVILSDTDSDEDIDMDEFDMMIDIDAEDVSQDAIDKLDALVSTVIAGQEKEVGTMTKEEVENYVSKAVSPSLTELDA